MFWGKVLAYVAFAILLTALMALAFPGKSCPAATCRSAAAALPQSRQTGATPVWEPTPAAQFARHNRKGDPE